MIITGADFGKSCKMHSKVLCAVSFMPLSRNGRSSFNLLLNLDDDNVRYNYLLKRKVKSKLNRVRRMRDNMNGFTNHMVSFAACDIPVASRFEHGEESLFGSAMGLMRVISRGLNTQLIWPCNFDHQSILRSTIGAMLPVTIQP